MSQNKRIAKYAKDNFNEILHTTLNPEGPGVVRIHLIPPSVNEGEESLAPSIAIINGMDIIPVGISWSILLSEFIKEVNKYEGAPVTEKDVQSIVKNVRKNVWKVFPLLPSNIIKNDIYKIMNTFKQIAYNEPVDEEIQYMSMGEYAEYMSAPHRMDLMISSMAQDGCWRCNQRCIHCYAAGQDQAEEKEISTEEWKRIIDKCRKAKIPQLTFTGGEPTMRDDLIELIEYSKWFVTRLNTNGILLTKQMCTRLKAASLDSMQITFYSENEEIHNKLVGANQYSNTLAGIENAVEAGLNISINTPLCTLNKDYVKTLEFLKSKGVIYVTCSGLITTGNALSSESEELQLSKEEIKQVLKDAVEYCFANGMEISFTSPGWIEEEFFAELGIMTPSCGACLSNMAVTPGGNVVPCQSWLSEGTLGNMLTDDWSAIWSSKECIARRDYSAAQYGICPLRKQ